VRVRSSVVSVSDAVSLGVIDGVRLFDQIRVRIRSLAKCDGYWLGLIRV
jgi:hypothetical protein